MLISQEYAEQNKALHDANSSYGTSGRKYAEFVASLMDMMQSKDVLDYGCGKGTLRSALNYPIREYDPAIPGKDTKPSPADIVTCTDVLEHIEPDCIDDVLDDLARVTKSVLFATVCVVPAKKTLADGRNAHILLKPFDWWAGKLTERFEWRMFQNEGHTFLAVLEPKK